LVKVGENVLGNEILAPLVKRGGNEFIYPS
jgi:hypothetical protein